jgi:hypothetical protein
VPVVAFAGELRQRSMYMQDPGTPPSEIVKRLIQLVGELYAETEGFLDQTSDAQLWYNRGYANGVAAALRELGHGPALAEAYELDPPDVAAVHALLPWGKAYTHGFEMGRRETFDVKEHL